MRYIIFMLCALSIGAAEPPLLPAADTDRWIAHLSQFAASHPGLTAAQQAIVTEGQELLRQGLRAKFRSPDAEEAADARRTLEAFKLRASRAFSRQLFADAFLRIAKPPRDASAMAPDCDCNDYTGECLSDCVTGSCRAMPEGCGFMGFDACFGLCQ